MTRRAGSIMAELPVPEVINAGDVLRDYLDGRTDLICILGPTASGKTGYAVRLAAEMDAILRRQADVPASGSPAASTCRRCEIISADSRQVYRGMDIGTGKDLDEYGDVPYHIIDVASAGEQYNVYRYLRDFIDAYSDIRGRGCIPILCGGTGLYINAVTSGYDFSEKKPLSETRDAGAARPEGLPKSTFFIGTLVSREVRNARIDARLDARLRAGMVEEIRGLLDSGVPAATLIGYGLEYKFVTLYLSGELGWEEMREKLATAIHQFAKRQMTWFRGMERSGARIHWTEV